MDSKDITLENVAKAVSGTIERGSVVTRCPIHETSGSHNPSLVISVTNNRHIIFHCRSQKCDATHFAEIRDYLIGCGLPRSRVGGSRVIHYDYHTVDGVYSWTKVKSYSKVGKKRFISGVRQEGSDSVIGGRPADAPRLYNLHGVAKVLAECPDTPLLIVEGEKDADTAGELGILATSAADGAGKWDAEFTRQLVGLGAKRVVILPDNDAAGIAHGITVAKSFQGAGAATHWLELPEAAPKADLSDWVPKQTDPAPAIEELIREAPLFDAEALDWRAKLKGAGRNASCSFRGDIPNLCLALQFEAKLKRVLCPERISSPD
jgi:hypothetical protein